MRRPLVHALAGAALLAGCGTSPPTRFFVLEPEPAAATYSASGPVRVAAVHLPDVLDRLQLVRALAPGRLQIDDRDRWGAPLGDMARRVLAQDLASRLAPGMVVFPRSPKPAGTRDLVVDVQAFQTGPDGRTVLQASWSLLGGDPERPLLRRQVDLSDAGDGRDAQAQAAAMSRLLGQLADRIAAELGGRG